MYGTTHLKGLGKFEGYKMSVWFKNENHITWKDDKPFIMSPDIITIVNLLTGEPTMNNEITKGDCVAVIGIKADDKYRTSEGIRKLGPTHFGFDFEYVPIEQVMQVIT